MKLIAFYFAVLCSPILFVFSNINQVSAQSVELTDSKTGKPISLDKLRRFTFVAAGYGVIPKSKNRKSIITFSFTNFITNDRQNVGKNIYHSDNQTEIKKFLQETIKESSIISNGKITANKNRKEIQRIVLEMKNKDGKHYEIFRYESGRSLVSFVAKSLELALEFEVWLTSKK